MPKQTSPARKRTRRTPEEARQLILDAAIRVFGERVPSSVGLKEIAREAGVSHALITHYYGTYEALVDASIDYAMSMLRKRLIDRMLENPATTPEQMVELYMEIALEPWYSRFVTWMLFSEREGETPVPARLVADMKLITAETERMLLAHVKPPPTRRQAEVLVVGIWSLVIGYVAANRFIWRALGHKPGPARDRDLRETIVALTREFSAS